MKIYNFPNQTLKGIIADKDIYKHMARKSIGIPYKNSPDVDFKSLLSDLEANINALERTKDFAKGGKVQKHALTWGEQRALDEQKGKKPQELKGGMTEEEKKTLAELDQIIALLKQDQKQLEQVWLNVQRELSKMDDDDFFSPLSIIASIAIGALTAGIGNMVFGSTTLASLPANFITNLTNSSAVISSLAGTAKQLLTKTQTLIQEDKLTIENLLNLMSSYTQEIHNLKSTRYDIEINAKVQDLKNKAQQQINALPKPLSQNEINSIATNVQQKHQQLNNEKTAFQAQERLNWLKNNVKTYGGNIVHGINGKPRFIFAEVLTALNQGTPILNLISNPIFTGEILYSYPNGYTIPFNIPLPPATIVHAPLPTLQNLIDHHVIPVNRTATYYNTEVAAITTNRDAAIAQVQQEGVQKEKQRLAKIAELEQVIRNKQQELQKLQEQKIQNENNFRAEEASVINKFKQALGKVSKDLTEAQNIKRQKLEQIIKRDKEHITLAKKELEKDKLKANELVNEIDRLLTKENISLPEYDRSRIDEFLENLQREHTQGYSVEDEEQQIKQLIAKAEKEQPEGFVKKYHIPVSLSIENQITGEVNPYITEEVEELPSVARISRNVKQLANRIREKYEIPAKAMNMAGEELNIPEKKAIEFEDVGNLPEIFKSDRNVKSLEEERIARYNKKLAQEWEEELDKEEDERERGFTAPASVRNNQEIISETEELLTPDAYAPLELKEMYTPDVYANRLSEELARLEKTERENLPAYNLREFFNGMSNHNIHEKLKKLQEKERQDRANELYQKKLNSIPRLSRNIPSLQESLKAESDQEAEDEWLAKIKEIDLRNSEYEAELLQKKMSAEEELEEFENSLISPVELESDKVIKENKQPLEKLEKEREEEIFYNDLNTELNKILSEEEKEKARQEDVKFRSIINSALQSELRLENRIRRADNIESPDYEYEDEDIIDILKANNLGENVGVQIAPLIGSEEGYNVFVDSLSNAIKEFDQGKDKVLVPINLGSAHWVSMMLSKSLNGDIIATYNDPLGDPIDPNIAGILNAIGVNNITDLQIQQQAGDLNCGAMAANNLIRMALDEPIMNTEEAIAHADEIRRNNGQDIRATIENEEEEVNKKKLEAAILISGNRPENIEKPLENQKTSQYFTPTLPEESLLLQNIINEEEKNKLNKGSPQTLESNYKKSQREQLNYDINLLNQELSFVKNDKDRKEILANIASKQNLLNELTNKEALKKIVSKQFYKQKAEESSLEGQKRLEKLEEMKRKAANRKEHGELLLKASDAGIPDEMFSIKDQNILNELRSIERNNEFLRREEQLNNLRKDFPRTWESLEREMKTDKKEIVNLTPEHFEEIEKIDPKFSKFLNNEDFNQKAWKKLAAKNMYTDKLKNLVKQEYLGPIPELPEELMANDVMNELQEFVSSNPKRKLVHLNQLNTDPDYAAKYVKDYLPKKHKAIEDPVYAAEINKEHNPQFYKRQIEEQERLNKMEKDIDFLLGGTGRQYDKAEVLHKYEARPAHSYSYNPDHERAVMKRYVRNQANKAGAQKQTAQWGGAFSGNYGVNIPSPFTSTRRANPLEFFGESKFNPYYYNPSLVY